MYWPAPLSFVLQSSGLRSKLHSVALKMIYFCCVTYLSSTFTCVTERAHLTDSQLIWAALDRTELVEHDDTVFSICGWKIPEAEQGFIPVCTHTYSTDPHTNLWQSHMNYEVNVTRPSCLADRPSAKLIGILSILSSASLVFDCMQQFNCESNWLSLCSSFHRLLWQKVLSGVVR